MASGVRRPSALLAHNHASHKNDPRESPSYKFGQAPSLGSLQKTMAALEKDEKRHCELIKELSKKVALGQTQTQHVQKKFQDSGYVFIKTIGQGHFGMVKMAKQKANSSVQFSNKPTAKGRRSQSMHSSFAAVRIIPRYRLAQGRLVQAECFSTEEKYKSLMLQIQALRSLDHPNICREYETFEDHQNIYIIMELYTGGELLRREDSAMPEARVAWVVDQLLSAMAHAHEKGVVHQDIRPENILYASEDEDSRIVLCDWSLASFVDTPAEDSRKALLVTHFSPPELDYRTRSDRGDIWSIGALAYSLLTLQFPFEKIPKEDFVWGNVGEQFSQPCRDFVESLMRFNPQARPSAIDALQHPWLTEARCIPPTPKTESALNSVATDMAHFKTRPPMQKAAANFAAMHLSGDKLHDLTKAFQRIDVNRDGVIDQNELQALLQQHAVGRQPHQREDLGYESDEELIDEALKSDKALTALFSSLDVDGSGMVRYSEFLAAATASLMENSVQLCWEAFKAFDINEDGTISQAEIEAIIQTPELTDFMARVQNAENHVEIKMAFDELGGVPESPHKLLQLMDKNKDSVVSFGEFMEALFGKSMPEEDMMDRRASHIRMEAARRASEDRRSMFHAAGHGHHAH